MWDAEGRAYVDFLARCGSVPLGSNHPELVRAAEESLRACLPSFVQPLCEAGLLVEVLASRLAPQLSCAHFVSSGSEAVDRALKLAFAATRRSSVLHWFGQAASGAARLWRRSSRAASSFSSRAAQISFSRPAR